MPPHSDTSAPAIVIEDEPTRPSQTSGAPIVVQGDPDVTVVDEDADGGFELPARARRNDNGTITLTLYEPIPVIIRSARHGERSETYAELTFSRLNGEAITAVSNAAEHARPIVLLAKSARIGDQLMGALWKKMDGSDIAAAQDIVASFFESGRKTRRRT